MEQGAVGLSTGLDYIVECFATTDELVAACRAIAPYGGLYVTHIRYKAELMPALREAVEIGRRAGVAVHVSHLKGSTPQIVEQVLEFIDKVARREVDFSFDVYPYQSGSTMLSALLPYEVWEEGPTRAAERLRDPVILRRFAQGLRTYKAPLDRVRLAWLAGKADKRHQGKPVLDYAKEMGASVEDALIALLLKEDLAVLMVVDEGDDSLVRPLLQHDLYMMGSDGIYFDDAPVHPRVYGSAGRLLGPCVRQWKLFSLEEAVHKLTGRPAHRFGARGRGILKEGNFADVVVFDPQRITDHATYAQPHRPTEGVEHVLVNGVPVIRDAKPIELLPTPLPGRWLRFNQTE
jgi:N-acyl-D-amino-acid deacylase